METDAGAEHTGWGSTGPSEPVGTTDHVPGPPVDPGGLGPSEGTIDQIDRLLDGVERALARLDDGTYGSCGACGAPIDDARLAAEPTVEACGTCATTPQPGDDSPGVVGDDASGGFADIPA